MIKETLYTSRSEEWETPQPLFDVLNSEFGFDLYPCASPKNTKCVEFYTKQEDGLSRSWRDRRVFMNPPYGKEIKRWMMKMATSHCEVGVALIHARTDTRWWHEWVEPYADEIRFKRGRVSFFGEHDRENNPTHRPPFPPVLVIYRKHFRRRVWGYFNDG